MDIIPKSPLRRTKEEMKMQIWWYRKYITKNWQNYRIFHLEKSDSMEEENKNKIEKWLQLNETLVKSILLYDSKTWRLSKVIGIRWSNKISKKKLYKITRTKPFLIKINEKKWKLLPHIFRMLQISLQGKQCNITLKKDITHKLKEEEELRSFKN